MIPVRRAGLPEESVGNAAKALACLESAAVALFGPEKRGLWAMLSAYFDESGTHPNSPICVVAGLVAPPLQWERLTVEWQRVLDSEGLPDFHMKDFAHSRNAFEGWDKERRDRLIRRLIPIIKRRVNKRVWTAVVMEQYRQLLVGDTNDEHAYGLCALGCASRLRWLALQTGKQDFYIPYMFEQGGKGSAIVFRAFENLLANGRGDFYRMSYLTVADRRRAVPLQAADLHAYEIFKYFSDQIAMTGRGLRASLYQLLHIPTAGGYLLTGPKIRQMMDVFLERHNLAIAGLPTKDEEPIPIAIDRLDTEECVRLRRVVVPP
jgi:hypothetical protein